MAFFCGEPEELCSLVDRYAIWCTEVNHIYMTVSEFNGTFGIRLDL